MRIRTRVIVVVTVMVIAGVTGRYVGDGSASADTVGAQVPRLTTAESVYLENPFAQRLVAYDRGAHRVTGTSAASHYVYYGYDPQTRLGPQQQLYTAGDGPERGLSVVQVSERSVTTLVSPRPHTGYFPLAAQGSFVFLSRTVYDAAGNPTGNAIVQRETSGNLSEYFDVAGTLDTGAILDGWLYYSVRNAPERYDVYKFEIGNRSLSPQPVEEGLEVGELYAHHGAILFHGDRGVQDGDVTYPCVHRCYFFDQPDVVVDLTPTGATIGTVTVYDGRTGTKIGEASDVVGFTVDSSGVRVYGSGSETVIRSRAA